MIGMVRVYAKRSTLVWNPMLSKDPSKEKNGVVYTQEENDPQDFFSLYVARIKIRFGKKKRIKTAQPVGEEEKVYGGVKREKGVASGTGSEMF